MGRGIGGHHSQKSSTCEWLTPPEIIEDLGPFDLDPCASINRPWDTAKNHYTLEENGLTKPWEGLVWCNPPYDRIWLKHFMFSMSQHCNGIALIFARTETEDFFRYVWTGANAVRFLKGRVTFYHEDGTKAKHNSGGPSVLVGYGLEAVGRLFKSNLPGHFSYFNKVGGC